MYLLNNLLCQTYLYHVGYGCRDAVFFVRDATRPLHQTTPYCWPPRNVVTYIFFTQQVPKTITRGQTSYVCVLKHLDQRKDRSLPEDESRVWGPGWGPLAQAHRSQVVRPSGVTSSRKGGRGGGGRKPEVKRPPSPSRGRVHVESSSRAPSHQSASAVSCSTDIPTPGQTNMTDIRCLTEELQH